MTLLFLPTARSGGAALAKADAEPGAALPADEDEGASERERRAGQS